MGDLEETRQAITAELLAQRTPTGYWEGELSASALSTATAVSALSTISGDRYGELIAGGIDWLGRHQNPDGGWGDTIRSVSNISTTYLARAAFQLAGASGRCRPLLDRSQNYIDEFGGVEALKARYGKDRTFAVPILTNCAIAGQIEWSEVEPLPFELACLPRRSFRWLQLPVVSYALPALIAIGQARHHHPPAPNLLSRMIRPLAKGRSLRVLESIQPSSGGFLEAIPLTSFVTMSLASIGHAEHAVARKGAEFLVKSVRPDGSWPIDINLSVWVTTLAVNALSTYESPASVLSLDESSALRSWLLDQQWKEVHPYTNAAPGGWGWTHLSGNVPDADDTPGALLALRNLGADRADRESADLGVRWLLGLQNRDGGWPTFCRGWGHLPFDRSGADLTAHVLRALHAWKPDLPNLEHRIGQAITNGLRFLEGAQSPEGYWLPLWFGNQAAPNDENRVYGTARVLEAYRDLVLPQAGPAEQARQWLFRAQNEDGGWGGAKGTPSSIEETAVALGAILPVGHEAETEPAHRGLQWLIDDQGLAAPAPIGFYFAKLWYFEKLYPLVFAVAALGRAARQPGKNVMRESCRGLWD